MVRRAYGLLVLLALAGPVRAQVEFIGNDVVDLDWSRYSYSGVTFVDTVITRDGQELARITDEQVKFFRDDTVSKGGTYRYRTCINTTDGTRPYSYCLDRTVTAGQVQGVLRRSLDWTGGEYTLYGVVDVQPGVTLRID
ncbi:MAG TPA: hypothetical protein VL049_08680, partial [Candidatus Dormibacteraeota bacterium]|nr:hypothetical protein [Candidatus Dormibacteraeota bacterium]